jgi:hypothetical protein
LRTSVRKRERVTPAGTPPVRIVNVMPLLTPMRRGIGARDRRGSSTAAATTTVRAGAAAQLPSAEMRWICQT